MNEHFNIASVFMESAGRNPTAVALIHDGKAVSYADLLQQVKNTSEHLRRRGILKGHKVLVFVPMSIDLYRIVLALFYLGAVPVFLDEWVSRTRLKECLHVVPCDAMVAGRKIMIMSFLIRELRNIAKKFLPASSNIQANHPPVANTRAADTALITFTSGSMGMPKAANRTHGFLSAQLVALTPVLTNNTKISLTLLPIVVLANLGLGKTSLLPPRGFSMKKPRSLNFLIKLVESISFDSLIASPAVALELAKLVEERKRSEFTNIITGGGPVFPQEAGLLSQSFHKATITIVYGSTEAEPISRINAVVSAATTTETIFCYGLPLGSIDRSTELGILPYGYETRSQLSSSAWSRLLLSPGQAGEIVVTGDHVLKTYIGTNQISLNKINVDGKTWHRTGDMGRLGPDGCLYFLGRCDELIGQHGQVIFPVLINYYLSRFLQRNGTVVNRQEGLVLVVEGKKPLKDSELEQLLERFGLVMITVRYLERLPRDPRHRTKIDYQRLRQII